MEKLKEDCIITDERLEYMKAIAELYVPNLEAEIYKNICTTTALPIFIKRYNQNKLKEYGKFTYEKYVVNKEIQDTLKGLGIDIDKFWFLLLFIFDYTCGTCIDGMKGYGTGIEQLKEAVQNIHGTITELELSDTELEEDVVSIPADPEVKNFSFTVVNEEVYYRENSVMNRMELPAMTAERVKGMVKIRDVTNELIQCQMEEGSDEQITKLQEKLNEEYDAFTAKYGLISSNANKRAFSQDSSYCLLTSLEFLDDKGELK